jgi:hypothetical protein
VKLWHALVIGAAVIGALYVMHMMTSHKGSQILPGLGVS